MNWLDILIIVIMAAAIAFGFRVGLIRMLFALAVIAGATVFATLLRQQAADIVGLFIADHNLAALGGYALVLIITIVAGWVVVGLVKTALKALMMGWLDTVGGVVFGAVAGCMLVVAVIWSLGVIWRGRDAGGAGCVRAAALFRVPGSDFAVNFGRD